MSTNTFTEISSVDAMRVVPRVSVYVAAYRHEKYLRKAVESIVAQKVDFPIEIVIGEDCSPDKTRAVALEMQRIYPAQVRVIAGDHNIGGLRNSTRCLALCRGDFIAFCEGDDYWHDPYKLQQQIDIMSADPQVMLCHTDYDRLIGSRLKRSMHTRNGSVRLAQGAAYIDLLHEWTVMTVTCVYRASLIHEFLATPFNRLDWPFGDYPKALFASVRGTVAYLPRSTGTWRKVRGSLSNAGFAATLRLRTAGLECKEAFMNAYSVTDEVRTSVRDTAAKVIMRDAFYAKDQHAYKFGMRLRSTAIQHPWRDWIGLLCLRLRVPVIVARAYRKTLLRITTHAL